MSTEQNNTIDPNDTPTYPLGGGEKPLFLARLRPAWRSMRREFQPRYPRQLLGLLREIFEHGHHVRYMPTDWEWQRDAKKISDAFDVFAESAAALRSVLHSLDDNANLLGLALVPRGLNNDGDSAQDAWWSATINTEQLLPQIVVLQAALKPFPERTRAGWVKDAMVRHLVKAVIWYIMAIEERKVRGTFLDEDGSPTSRDAVLVAVTLAAIGFGIKNSQLKTHFTAACKDVIKDKDHMGWYDIILQTPRRL